MSQIAIKIDPQLIGEFKRKLEKIGVVFEETTSIYESFRAKLNENLFVGYSSGKIVYSDTKKARSTVYNIISSLKPVVAEPELTIGSDEAGKGEWLGPLTVAAVAIDNQQRIYLQSVGVMDSKVLSKNKIKSLDETIRRHCKAHRVVTIAPEKFNQLFTEVKREHKSLNDILAWAHATAIKEVLGRLQRKPSDITVVIDEFDKLKTESRLKELLSLGFKINQRPRAEETIAVAAASILASAAREKWIDKYSKEIGTNLRVLSKDEVLKHPLFKRFIKISYIEDKGRTIR